MSEKAVSASASAPAPSSPSASAPLSPSTIKSNAKQDYPSNQQTDDTANNETEETQPSHSPVPIISTILSSSSPLSITLFPPLSFGLVSPGIYRSGCPAIRNLPFLRTLELKSIVYLGGTIDQYPTETFQHLRDLSIAIQSFDIGSNCEPFQTSDFDPFQQALTYALDSRNQPCLVHCNKGKHRTGCFVGIIRRLSGQSLSSTFSEYTRFIGGESASHRDLDRLIMECFPCKEFTKQFKKDVEKEYWPEWME